MVIKRIVLVVVHLPLAIVIYELDKLFKPLHVRNYTRLSLWKCFTVYTPSLLKFCEEIVERKIYPILWIVMYNHGMFVCVLLIFHLKLLYYPGWLLCDNCKSLQRPFNERWKMLEKEVIEPRNLERQHIYQSRNPYYRYDLEPFRVCFEGQRQSAITDLFP